MKPNGKPISPSRRSALIERFSCLTDGRTLSSQVRIPVNRGGFGRVSSINGSSLLFGRYAEQKSASFQQGLPEMANEEHIVSYTMDEIKARIARGEDQTDWAHVDALTDEEIEASIDFEEEGIPDFDNGRGYHIEHEQRVSMLLDDAIVAWFRAAVEGKGGGYKTRIAEVLREYVASQVNHVATGPPAPEASTGPSPSQAATGVPTKPWPKHERHDPAARPRYEARTAALSGVRVGRGQARGQSRQTWNRFPTDAGSLRWATLSRDSQSIRRGSSLDTNRRDRWHIHYGGLDRSGGNGSPHLGKDSASWRTKSVS